MSDQPVNVETAVTTTVTPSNELVATEPAATEGAQTDASGYRSLKTEDADEGTKVAVRDTEFRVVEKLPAIILLDLGLASDPSATQGEQLRAIRQFLHASIHPDDVTAFEHLLRTAQPVVEMDELNGIVEKLITEVAGRPTESPSASPSTS